MSTPAIELRALTKDYGSGRGVFDLALSVERGCALGFLGANGAGKTVTMRTLMGFVRPDAGSARIGGLDCFAERPRIQASLGYLPGEASLPANMCGTEFLDLMARMRGLVDRARREELCERFELDPSARLGRMSKGTRQKVALVCAFMGSPQVLLLDEPTSGLDPLMQERFVELVREERGRGTTILLSSHLFPEVERTCDRVAFIRAGRLCGTFGLDELRASRRRVWRLTFASAGERGRYAGATHGDARVRAVARGAGAADAATLEVEVTGSVDAFVRDLARFSLTDLETREQSLEDTFLHVYDATCDGNAAGAPAPASPEAEEATR